MTHYSIKELHQLLVTKKITPSQIVKEAFANLAKHQVLNATVTELTAEATALALELDQLPVPTDNYLFALPYFAKDNFATKGIKTTASSKILENFVPTYESTVTNILKQNNSILLGKSALDELGMGGHGLYALTGDVLNPWDLTRITGGSSSGSAALVAAGVVPFALGTDTGDSVRKPAGYCGIVGFKPTYGLISRYGVFPYAPSLDTVGYFTRTVEDSAIVFDYLAQEDHQDATSLKSKEQNYFKNLSPAVKNQKFAYLKNAHSVLPVEIKTHFDNLYAQLAAQGIVVNAIDFSEDLLKALLPVYMVISFAEAVSSHSMLDGINFGTRVDGDSYEAVMMNSRTEGFGHVVKRRYVIGSYALSKENQTLLFLKAKRVRRLIVDALMAVFKEYDILLLPTASSIAPKISAIKDQILTEAELENYVDDLLVLANLMGNPSLTLPLAFVDHMPIGINVNAAPFADQKVFNASLLIEEIIGIKNNVAPEGGKNNG
ncbi:aspartyl/glutamyl-tRNA amidotransferase subunit A [Spiroplasma sp. NBRC 100390]|uniref:amidase family protein n=1 Tax=unclassified Spiroplasma TaxID=2637901 RepID=UPI0008929DA3|nr:MULTISPECIES: amidase family protein [unclassified Spiroplasma]AOX44298.1 aspartyl/glutamyl-tRNA amidotransferase subunit A [Spiroplasma sp. TU-14]APE13768.1 aspartyl/glutamyl-tRNA amidotransferase subunit A [Spiroplasma sp. NBRC 100390]